MRVLLPVDFVLDDGKVSADIPKDRLQCDVGPKTRKLYEAEALAWAKSTKRRVAFHNGVMGKFEDKTFAGGTEAMVRTLKRLQAAGVAVYVGGGEGRAALERYGEAVRRDARVHRGGHDPQVPGGPAAAVRRGAGGAVEARLTPPPPRVHLPGPDTGM